MVYRLITANTIDEKILERASAKRKLEKLVIHKSKLCIFNIKLKTYTDLNHLEIYAHFTLVFFMRECICFSFTFFCSVVDLCLLCLSLDKFKGSKAELKQTKSCIDVNELVDLLKSRDYER